MQLAWDESRPKHKEAYLDEERKLEILRAAHWGTLATVSADGEPYCVPISFALDESDGSLVFHTALKGVKEDNLRRDARVCFSVVGSTEMRRDKFTGGYESVVIFGEARPISDKEESVAAALVFCRKFAPAVVDEMDVADPRSDENEMAKMMEKSSGFMAMYRLVPTHVDGKSRRGRR